ncbi:m10 protein [Murid betaherpesvirus 1]|nr:m10 protein [Murid betaherpesvirus 1]
MKVSPDRLLQLSLILAVLAPYAARKCDPNTSRAYSSRIPPGTCTDAPVHLEIKSSSHLTQTWVYECELPLACIDATWQVKWTVNRIPMNATALYNSTDSSLPKFDKILLINATTKPPPKGFTVNPKDGYLYLVSSPDETVSVHLQCEGSVCLPNKTRHVTTTNPPTTISRTKRDTTKFISISSRSQPVTRQTTDATVSNTASSTVNAVIVATAEMQTSNTTIAIVVPLMVILVATVIVLGFLYHYGFLRKWALLDSYLARLRAHFTTNDPESSRPESDPLNSPPTSVL